MSRFLIFSLTLTTLSLYSQSIELAVQKGHSGDINRIVFSSDGRLLASAGSDNLIKLWHVPTGKEMASFINASLQPVQALKFKETDDLLYVQLKDGVVHAWDIATSSLQSTSVAGIDFPSLETYTSNDGRHVVSIDRFYLRKKASTGKTRFSKVPIDISRNFTSVAVAETSNLIIASNEDGKVYAFDWNTGKGLGILDGHYASVNQVCVGSNGTVFASASSDRSIILWDSKTRKQLKRLFGRSFRFEALSFNHSGTQLAAGDELGRGRIIDLLSSRIKVSVASWHDQKVSDIVFSKNDSLIFCGGYDNRFISYSVPSDKILDQDKYKKYISAGDYLLKAFKAHREPYAWVNAVALSPSGTLLAVGGSWRESEPRDHAEPIWVENTVTGKVDKLVSHQGGVNDISFVSDVNFVSVHGNQLFNWAYDPAEGRYYFRKLTIPSVSNLRHVVAGPGKTIVLQDDHKLIHYDLEKEIILDSIHAAEEITYLACDRENGRLAYSLFNSLVVTSLSNWRNQRAVIEQAHTDRITGIEFNPQFPMLATVSWDATIKLWDYQSATLKATIIPIGSEDHLIITPDNYYYGTRNSLRGIGFKYGKQFISPEQFDLRFNRPDIVLDRLGFVPKMVVRSFNRAYQKRLQRMNFTEAMLSEEIHLPEVNIVSENIPVRVADPKFSLTVNAADSKYSLDRINVFINNIPVYGINGIDLRSRKVQQVEQNLTLDLSGGKNKIQISCLNEKGVESLLQTVEVDYETARLERPTLLVAVVSVSSYANQAMNLKYATKDGRDLVNQFSRSGWYGKIEVDSLFNARATKENILALREKFMKSSVNDHVVLYVSGHGLLDDNMDFYFATQDIDFKNPALRGLRYDDLENLLDGIPPRNKLLLMDACHSGEVDKSDIQVVDGSVGGNNVRGSIKTYTYPADVAEEHYQVGIKTSFELMQELFSNLSKGSGAVVISAAAGNSYALESDEWRNGVFTFSLLNGLKSKEADANRNGEVTVTELKNYVSREVEKLTRGAQKPTSRRENLEFDFRVY